MKKMGLVVACCLLSGAAWATAAVLIVTDEGGIDAPSESTLRRMTEAQLRAHGVSLVEDAQGSSYLRRDGLRPSTRIC